MGFGVNLGSFGVPLDNTGPSTSPGGSDLEIQFNDAGAFGGDPAFTFDKTTLELLYYAQADNAEASFEVRNTAGTNGGAFLLLDDGAYHTAIGTGVLDFNTDTNLYRFGSTGSIRGILDFGSVATSNKTFTFPNTTGTIALTSNIITAHSGLTGLTTGDDHTQYALLAGRSGGQTLIGGTSSGQTLTLKGNSTLYTGSSSSGARPVIDDPINFISTNRTFTSSVGNGIDVSATLTMDFASATFGRAYSFEPTLIFTQGSGAATGTTFVSGAHTQNADGVAMTLRKMFGFVVQSELTAVNAAVTGTDQWDFTARHAFRTSGTGTLTVTDYFKYYSPNSTLALAGTVGTGVTLTNLKAFYHEDATGSGTVTNQIGINIANLTKGTNNTSILLGQASAPSGNYTIYSAATYESLLSGNLVVNARMKQAQGVDVGSANNLVLGSDGNTFEITGTTQINLISNLTWQNGSVVILLFTSTPTVKHNQATSGTNITIQLAGAADFAATAGDTLTLVLSEIGGTQAWREVARAVI